jgi:hypothetical protein
VQVRTFDAIGIINILLHLVQIGDGVVTAGGKRNFFIEESFVKVFQERVQFAPEMTNL